MLCHEWTTSHVIGSNRGIMLLWGRDLLHHRHFPQMSPDLGLYRLRLNDLVAEWLSLLSSSAV